MCISALENNTNGVVQSREEFDAGKDWRQKEKGVAEEEIDSITNSMDMNLSKLCKIVKDKEAWWAAVYGDPKHQTQLSNWTTTTRRSQILSCLFFSLAILKTIEDSEPCLPV